jgi:hypothetical protein
MTNQAALNFEENEDINSQIKDRNSIYNPCQKGRSSSIVYGNQHAAFSKKNSENDIFGIYSYLTQG